MSGGMCALCKLVPAEVRTSTTGKENFQAYCRECRNKLAKERYHKKTMARRGGRLNHGQWKNSGSKKPPTDWREVLRKADEGKQS